MLSVTILGQLKTILILLYTLGIRYQTVSTALCPESLGPVALTSRRSQLMDETFLPPAEVIKVISDRRMTPTNVRLDNAGRIEW